MSGDPDGHPHDWGDHRCTCGHSGVDHEMLQGVVLCRMCYCNGWKPL